MRASILLVLLLVLFLSGCETTKGAVMGGGAVVISTGQGIAKDSTNFWQAALRLDDWMRENLW
ncbi:MAG: hypothetical protein ISS44_02775 [Candidatus Omnitrophica bacterium]|nr:hypothetical protein [Candidatus Omnitrophota bacterium]